jgi:hypothetical protein
MVRRLATAIVFAVACRLKAEYLRLIEMRDSFVMTAMFLSFRAEREIFPPAHSAASGKIALKIALMPPPFK